jgi:hypothetical protein
MFFDHPSGNGKAQARAAVFIAFDLIEFFEDLLEFILRDAYPGVLDFVKDIVTLLTGDDRNLSSLRSKFEGVGKEIDKDIVKPVSVGINEEIFRNINLDGEVFIHRFHLMDISLHYFGEEDPLLIDAEVT